MSRVNDRTNVPEKAGQIEVETGIPKRFRANMADQMLYCMRHLRGGYFHIILSLQDRIDEERFAKSVRLAADAEPLLGSRFIDHWFRPYWERRDDLEDLELFRLEEGPHTEDALNRFITEICDPRFDAQFKILLLRSDTDTICLRLNHMVGDGGAGKDLIYLLASIYNRLGEDPNYRPWPNLDGDRSYRRIGRQLELRDKVAILRNFRWPVRELLKAGPGWQLPLPDHGRKRGVLSFLVLPSERGQAIISYARRHQTSVNFVLSTAFFRALEAVVPHPTSVPLPILMTVDLRRYLPSKRADALCNHAGAEILFVRSDPGAQFNHILGQFQKQFEALKKSYLGLNSIPLILETFPLINVVSAFMPFRLIEGVFHVLVKRRGTGGSSILSNAGGAAAISNVGELDPERSRFGNVAVKNVYITSTLYRVPGMLGIVVTYFRNAITLSAHYMENCLSQNTVQAVLDRIDRELPQ